MQEAGFVACGPQFAEQDCAHARPLGENDHLAVERPHLVG
jgi:hypothetical protein